MAVNRRRFALGTLGLSVAPQLLAAPPKRPVRIAIVMTEFPNTTMRAIGAVTDGLRELGYVEGANVEIVRQTAHFPDGPMRKNVEGILAAKPDVIVAGCGWSTNILMQLTRSVPVVIISAGDPVIRGWVSSLARPGANITGVSSMMDELPAKMLDHLRLMMPSLKTVGIGFNTRIETHKTILKNVESTAEALGVRVAPIDLNPLTTVPLMRDALRASGVQAILNVPGDELFWTSVNRIIAAAKELRLPIAASRSDFLDEGVFLSYGAHFYTVFRQAASYMDRILNGARPAELPIEGPTKLEFGVNLKTAAELGITVPRSILARADALIK